MNNSTCGVTHMKSLWEKLRLPVVGVGGALLAYLLLIWPERSDETRNGWDKLAEISVKVIIAVTGAIASWMGGWAPITSTLAVVMGMDYLSGFIVGLAGKSRKTKSGRLSSKVGFIGILKKGMMLGVVILAHQLDLGVGMGTNTFRDLACWWYIANDAISFLENLSLLGIRIPPPLKKALDQVKENGEPPRTKTEDKSSNG